MTLSDMFNDLFPLLMKTIWRNSIITLLTIFPAYALFGYALLTFYGELIDSFPYSNMLKMVVYHPTDDFWYSMTMTALSVFVLIAGYVWAYVSSYHLVGKEMLGVRVSWQEAYRQGIGIKFVRAFGAMVIILSCALAFQLLPVSLIIFAALESNFLLLILGILSLLPALVLSVYVIVPLYFSVNYIAVEEVRLLESLQRSWKLVRSYWWRTFGLLLLFGILTSLAISSVLLPFQIIGGVASMADVLFSTGNITMQHGGDALEAMRSVHMFSLFFLALNGMLTNLCSSVYLTMIFIDLRVRKGEALENPEGYSVR